MTPLEPKTVALAALATLLARIAVDYRARGVETVDLSTRDFYRAFGTDEMFDVYADMPSPIGIGSLHDDLAELSKLLRDPDRMPTSLDLERLGNVLRALAEAF